ncbi:hypothetical protein [Roseovarius sp. M141]|uniref:hypothetical protein n=1 Tax=Roseovarius sp. M141 TaxID=2583806 RepID=UPI0020CF3E6E|nr:hypothetical protein [Roseovarius sp. M141]MCQ0093528.1 hypothetical protein [Roseovarius sp. M141]
MAIRARRDRSGPKLDEMQTVPLQGTRKSSVAWLFALMAITGMADPAKGGAPPCEGTYEYFFGKSFVNVAPGNALPDAGRIAQAYNNREGWVGQTIRKPQSEGLFEMEVNQCGREFVISQGGKSMLFVQSANDDTTYVAQDIGIESGSLTMRVIGHKVFVGKLEGVSEGFKYTFPVAMEPRDTVMPNMDACSDSEEAEAPDFAQENTATRGFLAARGMTPPAEYAPGDYFRALETERDLAGTARDGSTRHIRFRMGRSNAILPEIGMREICQAGPGKLDPPRRFLNFKIFRVEKPDGYLVFAQEIDIETGKILGQAEGESIGREAAALQAAMTDAATALEASGTVIGPLSDGIVP